MCTPQLNEGFIKENTRYVKDVNGNLVVGNWINKKPDNDWYDYKNQKWANIFVESEGIESYYVWIPRYVYKIDDEKSVTGNERMDVKFVDIDNSYKDPNTDEKQIGTHYNHKDINYQRLLYGEMMILIKHQFQDIG